MGRARDLRDAGREPLVAFLEHPGRVLRLYLAHCNTKSRHSNIKNAFAYIEASADDVSARFENTKTRIANTKTPAEDAAARDANGAKDVFYCQERDREPRDPCRELDDALPGYSDREVCPMETLGGGVESAAKRCDPLGNGRGARPVMRES